MSKITMATIKSFIRKNAGQIYIRNLRNFDGMVDGVRECDNKGWRLAGEGKFAENDHGVGGAWFVGRSGDYLQPLSESGFTGFHVYNCCGSFDIAVRA